MNFIDIVLWLTFEQLYKYVYVNENLMADSELYNPTLWVSNPAFAGRPVILTGFS